MAKPSLSATSQGVHLAKQALTKAGWTQKSLSILVRCSRQPITNFFKGEAIAQVIFLRICEQLGLDWQEVADFGAITTAPVKQASPPSQTAISRPGLNSLEVAQEDITGLVQDLRQQVYAPIQERCGTMRILDMSYPIGVEDIYTDVNILEQITGRRRKRLDELLENYDFEAFNRLGVGQITEARIPGTEAVQRYGRLIILGKPGAGKTTFLKHLAIQCNVGKFAAERLPVFVTLKDFAEEPHQPSLLEYISRRDLNPYFLSFNQVAPAGEDVLPFLRVFEQGLALILLDGLDEVRADDHDRVLWEIRNFSQQYWHNHFVITCRIAAWEYTFEKFTEVEIADFDENQVANFAAKWFSKKNISSKVFLQSLNQSPQIYQLAVSPLLLTLLCLTYEESGEFPASRTELYKEGIDTLLKRWDASRGIQRQQIYKRLSLQHKQDLLSHIALITFRSQEYFFKQSVVEDYIADYLADLPNAETNPEALKVDSEAVLRSIEAQHGLLVERAKGIYSFSHLTFQEYFAAREIVFNAAHLDQSLQDLLSHLHEPRWQEIFLITTELLRDASRLLLPMKQQVDQLLAREQKLQGFLQYVVNRAANPEFSGFKPLAVRAFWFDIDFNLDKQRSIALLADPTAKILVCASFLTRILRDTSLSQAIAIAQDYESTAPQDQRIPEARSADEAMGIGIQIALRTEKLNLAFREVLETLAKEVRSEASQDQEALAQVADEARKVAKRSLHHIGSDTWDLDDHQFSDREKKLLRQYYNATELLLRCLKSEGCRMDRRTRQQIEETLMLPI